MVELCRVCLSTGASIHLFHTVADDTSSQIYFKLMSCTAVQASHGDMLPKLLCTDCANRLDDAYRLRELAQKTDAHLRHQLGVVKIENSSKILEHKINTDKMEDFNMENVDADRSSESNFGDNEMTDTYEDVKFSMNDVPDSKDISFTGKTNVKVNKANTETSLEQTKNSTAEQSKIDDRHENKHSVTIPNKSCISSKCETVNREVKVSKENKGKVLEVYIKRCQLCPQVFPNDLLHKKHMEECHPYFKKTTNQKTIMCDTCGKSLASSCALRLHLLVHTGEKPFICTICKKGFVNAGNLRKHVIAVHDKDKPYHCKLCPARFGDSSTRRRHHIKEHTENLDNVCQICKKPFVTASKLIRHRLTHLKPRANICKVCSLTFARRYDLVDHIKRVHIDVPPENVDDYCGKVPVK